MELRAAFTLPFTVSTPVELVKHGAVPIFINLGKKNG